MKSIWRIRNSWDIRVTVKSSQPAQGFLLILEITASFSHVGVNLWSFFLLPSLKQHLAKHGQLANCSEGSIFRALKLPTDNMGYMRFFFVCKVDMYEWITWIHMIHHSFTFPHKSTSWRWFTFLAISGDLCWPHPNGTGGGEFSEDTIIWFRLGPVRQWQFLYLYCIYRVIVIACVASYTHSCNSQIIIFLGSSGPEIHLFPLGSSGETPAIRTVYVCWWMNSCKRDKVGSFYPTSSNGFYLWRTNKSDTWMDILKIYIYI